MTDYRQIELHIRRARLERSMVLGNIIANGIFVLWTSARRLAARAAATIKSLVETPDEFSTALPRRF